MARYWTNTVEMESPAAKRAGRPEPARLGDQSPGSARLLLSLQQRAGNRAVSGLLQRSRSADAELQARLAPPAKLQPEPVPRRNETGLPDGLRSGVESLSGISLDDVEVHYNSAEPARRNALAYAQGIDIHVAPGQERHLPHEAWHVVQQAQGRVQPTTQLRDGMPINDDQELEHEADAMGARASATAAQRQPVELQHAPARFAPVVAPGRAPVQRVLAHTQPIVPAEVATVEQKGGKLVFVLDGGLNGSVVVKFETFGATESLAQYADRSAALRAIAAGVLQNVPGSSSLTAADMQAIAQIPAAVGGDLAFLKQMAAGVLAASQGYDRLLAMKLEHINVGQNLQALVTAAAGAAPAPAIAAGPGGRARARAAPVQPAVIPHDSPLWGEFGKMAAFDLLVSNNDRFSPTEVNLENVDLRGGQGVSLDVVDPNSPLLKAEPWEGEAAFRNPATWAQHRVGEMCDSLHINPLFFGNVLDAFKAGFIAAKTQLKAQEAQFQRLGLQLQGRGQAGGSLTYRVMAARLRKI